MSESDQSNVTRTRLESAVSTAFGPVTRRKAEAGALYRFHGTAREHGHLTVLCGQEIKKTQDL